MQIVGANSAGDSNVQVEFEEEGDDEDENDSDDVEDEEDDEDVNYWNMPQHVSWDRNHDWWPRVTEPREEGLSLLMSGEFGRVQHQLRARGGHRNVASSLLNKGLSSRPTYREDITGVRPLFLILHASSCSTGNSTKLEWNRCRGICGQCLRRTILFWWVPVQPSVLEEIGLSFFIRLCVLLYLC